MIERRFTETACQLMRPHFQLKGKRYAITDAATLQQMTLRIRRIFPQLSQKITSSRCPTYQMGIRNLTTWVGMGSESTPPDSLAVLAKNLFKFGFSNYLDILLVSLSKPK